MQTQEAPKLAGNAIKWLDYGVWPDRLADRYVESVDGMTREEAMATVQYAIRQGAGRDQKLWNPESFLTDDIDLFYSHSLQ